MAETQGASLSKQIDSLSFPIKSTSLAELIQQEVCSEGEGVKKNNIKERISIFSFSIRLFVFAEKRLRLINTV